MTLKLIRMSKFIKLSTLIVVLSLFSCSSDKKPSLCDCLTNPDYANYGTENYKKCKEVFQDKYETPEPNNNQMSSDYYKCKN